MFCFEPKGRTYTVEVIEKDAYGRTLFKYQTENYITDEDVSTYVICQTYDSEYVYYYEDVSYCFEEDANSDFSEIKEKNDWDAPLDYSKMSRRSTKQTFDLYIVRDDDHEMNKSKEACRAALGIDPQVEFYVVFIDSDSNGNVLYWLEFIDDSKTEYFVIIDSEYKISSVEVAKEEINSVQFAELKAKSGWHYGFDTSE